MRGVTQILLSDLRDYPVLQTNNPLNTNHTNINTSELHCLKG